MEYVPQKTFIPKLQAAMSAGKDYPDIIEWPVENNQNHFLSNDPKRCPVLPLEKYTQKSEIFKHVIPGRVSYLTYGKHIYGLPHDAHPVILIYNDTLWKEAGIDVAAIETWDEFFDAAAKLGAARKDGKPLHYALPQNNSLYGTMFMIWQQSDAQFLDKDGKPCFTSPAFQAFVEKWLAWYKSDTMCEWDWGNFATQLKNGALCSYVSPDWYTSQIYDTAKAGNYQLRARSLPLYAKGGPPTASWGGSFLAIVKTAKNRDFLYKIIEYMQYIETFIKDRYRGTGILAPIDSVYNDESYHLPGPRFGGQKVGELLISMARQIPSVQSGDIFWDAINDFNTVYPDIVSGKISVEEGLQKVQDEAMKRYNDLKLK